MIPVRRGGAIGQGGGTGEKKKNGDCPLRSKKKKGLNLLLQTSRGSGGKMLPILSGGSEEERSLRI